jgi:hypothetical protein
MPLRPGHHPRDYVDGYNTITNSTANAASIAAPVGGERIYIDGFVMANTSGGDTEVNIKDGSTTKLTVSVPAGGGSQLALNTPIKMTAETAVNVNTVDSVASVHVALSGFVSK